MMMKQNDVSLGSIRKLSVPSSCAALPITATLCLFPVAIRQVRDDHPSAEVFRLSPAPATHPALRPSDTLDSHKRSRFGRSFGISYCLGSLPTGNDGPVREAVATVQLWKTAAATDNRSGKAARCVVQLRQWRPSCSGCTDRFRPVLLRILAAPTAH